MRRYRVINPARFQMFKDVVIIIGWILLTIMFVKFIDAHDGVGTYTQEVREYYTYEYVTQTSEENDRIKETVPIKVVYRYVER